MNFKPPHYDNRPVESVWAMELQSSITFSKAGNAASNLFESGAVLAGGGDGGAAQQEQYPDELRGWFSALKISDAKTQEVLDYVCGDEVGVTEVGELPLLAEECSAE